jgi:hypothetical protein
MVFACSCGRQLRVPDDFAGKRVQCPNCSAIQTVPEPASAITASPLPAMARPAFVRFECVCGKVMQAKADFAGRNTRCPACQSTLVIPHASEPLTGKLPVARSVDDPEVEDRPARRGRRRSPWRWVALAAALLLLIAGGLGAYFWLRGSGLRDNLALVPGDAKLFATIRLADAWNSAAIKQSMEGLPPMMRNALEQAERDVGMKIADVERVTFVAGDYAEDALWVVVSASQAFDRKKLLDKFEFAEESTHRGRTYHLKGKTALCFLSDRLLAFGSPGGVRRCLDQQANPVKPSGALADALQMAERKHHLVVFGTIPTERLQEAKGRADPAVAPYESLFDLRDVTLTEDFLESNDVQLDVRLGFPSEARAREAVQAIDLGLKEIKKALPGFKAQIAQGPQAALVLQAFAQAEKELGQLQPNQDGSNVRLSLKSQTHALRGGHRLDAAGRPESAGGGRPHQKREQPEDARPSHAQV